MALRDGEAVIVDAKAAKPKPSHEIRAMLYMIWLPLLNPKLREVKLPGQVYYREEAVINIPATRVRGLQNLASKIQRRYLAPKFRNPKPLQAGGRQGVSR